MPLQIVRNDITHMKVDAIVNSACKTLGGGGGVDGAIHKAAGPGLLEECRALGGCRVGEAKITKGYNLPARYVIHTVGPVWGGGIFGEKKQLESCYRSALEVAHANGLESVAFPLISAGIFGFPRDTALKIAMDTITDFLMDYEMMVYIVVFDRESFHLSGKLFHGISQYIDEKYVNEHTDFSRERFRREMMEYIPAPTAPEASPPKQASFLSQFVAEEDMPEIPCCSAAPDWAAEESAIGATFSSDFFESADEDSLKEALRHVDESFSTMVLRLIDEKGMTDPECYKRANMDRKLFSKIRNDVFYKPKKTTAVALAIALRLDRDETEELLLKAGYALSPSSKFDIIIEYCLGKKIYDIHRVNEILFDFDQLPLGV